MSNIKNAVIRGTTLGYEDHGMLTAWVHVEWDNGGVGFGGNCLDEVVSDANGKFLRREGHAYGMEFIARILKTVGCDTWEKLPGEPVRVSFDHDGLVGGRCISLGHYLKENWFNPKDLAKEFFPDKKE